MEFFSLLKRFSEDLLSARQHIKRSHYLYLQSVIRCRKFKIGKIGGKPFGYTYFTHCALYKGFPVSTFVPTKDSETLQDCSGLERTGKSWDVEKFYRTYGKL